MDVTLITASFIAGMLTFLAPCTLPLVPGYLGFISGGRRVFVNGLLYVIGFSTVFILLGSLFGLGGGALVRYRLWLARLGGLVVIAFGLSMLGVVKLPFLNFERRLTGVRWLKPGHPWSSFLFGATFAFGWSPCVGPILGTILLLASTTATVGQGAGLLAVFAAGLAVPFLLVAAATDRAAKYLGRVTPYLKVVSFIGGGFLLFLGVLLLTNRFSLWIAVFYRLFSFVNYERLLNYL